MQELEKILEEIDAHAIEFETFGVSDDYISVGWVKEIIRKHMNEKVTTNDLISRQALLDDFRNTITENSDTFDWLNMIARQPTANKGDSWIAVEDRLPEIFGKYWATIRYGDGRISEPVVVDFLGVPQKYVVDTPNGMEYETWGIDSAFHGSRVIAWRPYYIPEPYQPKPQNKPEERYPEWRAKLLSKFDRRE